MAAITTVTTAVEVMAMAAVDATTAKAMMPFLSQYRSLWHGPVQTVAETVEVVVTAADAIACNSHPTRPRKAQRRSRSRSRSRRRARNDLNANKQSGKRHGQGVMVHAAAKHRAA